MMEMRNNIPGLIERLKDINCPDYGDWLVLLQDAITAVRKQVIEEVFGEFRPLITEMRVALYDDDTNRIKDVLARLEHQMFVEGL